MDFEKRINLIYEKVKHIEQYLSDEVPMTHCCLPNVEFKIRKSECIFNARNPGNIIYRVVCPNCGATIFVYDIWLKDQLSKDLEELKAEFEPQKED